MSSVEGVLCQVSRVYMILRSGVTRVFGLQGEMLRSGDSNVKHRGSEALCVVGLELHILWV